MLKWKIVWWAASTVDIPWNTIVIHLFVVLLSVTYVPSKLLDWDHLCAPLSGKPPIAHTTCNPLPCNGAKYGDGNNHLQTNGYKISRQLVSFHRHGHIAVDIPCFCKMTFPTSAEHTSYGTLCQKFPWLSSDANFVSNATNAADFMDDGYCKLTGPPRNSVLGG